MQSDIGGRHTEPTVGKRYFQKNKKKPVVGIEPTTGALRMRYSTSELHRLAKNFDWLALPLSYIGLVIVTSVEETHL